MPSYASLGRETFDAVLGMLAASTSDEFAELRATRGVGPRRGHLRSRGDARTVAVISGGTIPERGLFPVYLADDEASADAGPGTRARAAHSGGRRGRARRGDGLRAREGRSSCLAPSAWRIESIGHDRVTVSPAPGEPGKVPFWKGDQVGRPAEPGRELGAFIRTIAEQADGGAAGAWRALRTLREHHDLDDLAARNLLAYLDEERGHGPRCPRTGPSCSSASVTSSVTGASCCCRRSALGARAVVPRHQPASGATGVEVSLWSDDGIVIRLPASEMTPGWGAAGDDETGWAAPGSSIARTADDAVLVPSDEVELVVGAVGSSALFASRFRENAARALLLPQRGRGAARRCGRCASAPPSCWRWPAATAPSRSSSRRTECLQDVFDLPALRDLLGAIERRECGS